MVWGKPCALNVWCSRWLPPKAAQELSFVQGAGKRSTARGKLKFPGYFGAREEVLDAVHTALKAATCCPGVKAEGNSESRWGSRRDRGEGDPRPARETERANGGAPRRVVVYGIILLYLLKCNVHFFAKLRREN